MPLEGLRAWIGEVERKLGMRTRVFLVLTVIAIGIGGAAIYLAIDARESSVSEGDVQALQEDLEAQIGASAASGSGSGGDSGGRGTAAEGPAGAAGTAPAGSVDSARLKERIERAKGKKAPPEEEQAEK